jgi:hypothetical protein
MDNVKESMTVSNVSLPGITESAVIAVDNTKAYFAVPTAPVPGDGTAGGIFISSLSAADTLILPIPAAHYLAQSGDGSRLLAFSDNSDSVTVVSPFNIQPGQKNAICNPTPPTPSVCQTVSGFARLVAGFFGTGTTNMPYCRPGRKCVGCPMSGPPGSMRLSGPTGTSSVCWLLRL